MYNCIYSGHCVEDGECSVSCPILAQTSYLLERNNISMNNPVFKLSQTDMNMYADLLASCSGKLATVTVKSGVMTNLAADALTYCAVCENWKGSQLHCVVYNLKFAQYLEEMTKGWSPYNNSSDTLAEYMKIWATKAKVLIVSNIDFVNFKEFQSQTLLSLLQARVNSDNTTIIVSPPISSLVGEGQFFGRLTETLKRQKVGEAT